MWEPPQPAIEFLLPHLDDAWRRLQGWLENLSEAEFQWRPVANVWHLEERDGHGAIPYSWIPPEPAPLPTIAWHVAHVATSLALTTDHAFGERRKKLADLRLPLTAGEMLDYLAACHGEFVKAVAALSDADLERPRYTEWGEQRSTAEIVGSAILHEVEHGAQITALRSIYRHWKAGEIS
jgi:DinB superfamily